jgi:hypothetical protein
MLLESVFRNSNKNTVTTTKNGSENNLMVSWSTTLQHIEIPKEGFQFNILVMGEDRESKRCSFF